MLKKIRVSTVSVWMLALFVLILSTSGAAADTTYIVQRGDTLASIGRQFGVTIDQIVAANNIVNPNLIYANQRLTIPTVDQPAAPPASPPVQTETVNHTVGRGETMYRIALQYGVTVQAISQANEIDNPNVIYSGQVLVIPVPADNNPVFQPTATATTAAPVVEPTAVSVQPTATPQPTAVPVQPTAVPVQPTQPPIVLPTATAGAPAPPVGVNLLPNGSFEAGWYHPGDVPELQIPNNWRFEWDEGATGFGNEVWDVWRRPEVRVLSRQFLPPEEHGLFIWDGDQTLKVFKGGAPMSFRLVTDVTLQPGTYLLEINFFPDLVVGYDGGKIWAPDPLSGEVRLMAGNGGTDWIFPSFGQRQTYRYQFTVTETQMMRVGAALRGRFAIENNGWFLDNWSLTRVE